ncbi:PD-(D/E)XK nuclease family protein [Calothrix membranacea FACHB-236]|nr:PD-(D/E)XK nuclease family protein [Calothrix membranacea FACHB-236]
MSLFRNLLKLHSANQPLEDFFTEIVAYFFSLNKDILISWLKQNSIITDENYTNIKISTQQEYKRLPNHTQDSRPDIVVELSNSVNTHIIFIESKIGSVEGEDQLKRYAEILYHQENFTDRSLIYITREYEQKNHSEILHSDLSSKVKFHQLRWYQFYSFLSKRIIDTFAKEILMFMEVNRMAHTNQLSSLDILTMINFNKTLNFMESTLSDEVSDKFKQTFGGVTKGAASLTQYENKSRYIIYRQFYGWHFWCSLGYFDLNPDTFTQYPYLGIRLEVSPTYVKRPEIIIAMQEIVEKNSTEWTHHHLYTKDWSSIFYRKSLQDFLSDENHVSSIKKYFFKSIEVLKEVQKNYPHLPW